MANHFASSGHVHIPASTGGPDWMGGLAATTLRLAAGAALFRQGTRTLGLFRVLSGRVRLVRLTPGGGEVPMHTAVAGELFAEASIFSAHYHCDAIALQDCEILVYPKAELTRHLLEKPEMLWAFTAEMARRTQDLRTRLEVRQIRSAPDRVLQFLRLRCDADGNWSPPGTLKQWAQELGLTHEALYRALATLEREGRIQRADRLLRLVTL